MTLTLRPYQQQLIDSIRAEWDAGHRNVLAVMPTRSGKTVTFAAMNADGTPSCTIVHRQELVGQISRTYAMAGTYHNIIAPQPVINFCIQQHIKTTGRNYFDPRATVHVAGVDTLIRRFKPEDRWCAGIKRWTCDECFVAGTLIDNMPIETIRVGDTVTAFDETSGRLVRRTVVRTFKNRAPSHIIKVATTHHVLYVTNGHPFWTQRGWVVAGELTNDDTIFTDTLHAMRAVSHKDGRAAALQVAQNRSDFLHTSVRLSTQGQTASADPDSTTNDDLSYLQPASGQKPVSHGVLPQKQSSVLFNGVQQETSCTNLVRNNGEHQQNICIGKNASQKPDEFRDIRSKNEGHASIHRTQAESQGRKWQACDKSRDQAAQNVRTDGVRKPNSCGDGFSERNGTRSLQDRLWSQDFAHSDRSGRCEPHIKGPSGVGCTKGQVLVWQRVESISVLKRDDPAIPGDGYVYNIEVDGVHTYLANGVVVHNCHHLLAANKWGKATALFPHAHGLGVTATPIRADRKSLHADQTGVFHALVQGPGMRDLIESGAVCDYRIIAPQSGIDEALLRVGSTGDFTPASAKAAQKSELVGDIVQTYLDRVPGQQAIVFAVDVQDARDIAARFQSAGVDAESLDGTSNDAHRQLQVDRFARGELRVLTNVDLFGEGFDVPACDVVIMARPTASFGLFCQQFARCLTPAPGKTHGTIIDHVGNVMRMAATHGMPDTPRRWTLWQEPGKAGQRNADAVPVRVCPACALAYPALSLSCPYCGEPHVPSGRGTPQQVDGILSEMSPELLAQLRAAAAKHRADEPAVPYGASDIVRRGIFNRHRRNQEAQAALADVMERWGGVRRAAGDDDTAMQARFLHRFGVDVLTAQGLAETAALELRDAIMESLG